MLHLKRLNVPNWQSRSHATQLNNYVDEFHIYPQVNGALLSWNAAKGPRVPPPFGIYSISADECRWTRRLSLHRR